MHALLTLDVARDAVADQFAYDRPLADVVTPDDHAPVAPRTRSLLAATLHRLADAVTPAPARYSPAR